MSTPRVAVIGGGAAGLVAALQFRAHGIEVALLEASDTTGGMIRTVRRDGWIAEAGANSLAEPEAPVRALLDGAGLADRTLRAQGNNTRRYIVHRGALVAVPRSVGELIAWPILSAAGRMRLLKEPFIKAGSADAEETVDAFVRRRLGDEMAEHVFDPLVGASCAGDSKQVLMRYAFPQLVEWERLGGSLLKGSVRAGMDARRKAGKARAAVGGLWSCPAGLGEVPERATRFLGSAVRTGVKVTAVVARGAEFDVVDAEGQAERFAGVVCAVPAAALAHLRFQVPGAEILGAIASVPHASLASVSLGFRRDQVAHSLEGHGLLAPSAERREILGTLFVSSLYGGRAPDGHVLLTSFLGGVQRSEIATMPEPAMIETVQRELASLLGVTGAPAFASVTRWPTSQPQSVAGHGARLAAVSALEESVPGLNFAGAWHDGLSLVDAMRSGRLAADRLVQQLGSA